MMKRALSSKIKYLSKNMYLVYTGEIGQRHDTVDLVSWKNVASIFNERGDT